MAENLYWVGGSGSWNSVSNWSLKSGGVASGLIPSASDNVHFDQNSFKKSNQSITISSEAYCKDFNWINSGFGNSIAGNPLSNLLVSGSFVIQNNSFNSYLGTISFVSPILGNIIKTNNQLFKCNIIFDNAFGGWLLQDKFNSSSTVTLLAGSFSSNGNSFTCKSFVSNGINIRVLDFTNSFISIEENWNIDGTSNFTFAAQSSNLNLKSKLTPSSFVSKGGLQYGKFGGGPQQQAMTVTTTVVPSLCNGTCLATATANPLGGVAPYTYLWSDGQTTQTAVNLCAGTYLVVVTDAVGTQVAAFATVTDPPPIIIFFTNVSPLCNGDCNGSSSSSVAGGTPPYSYLWTPGNQNTPNITNQCAGVYTCTVTDANGCVRTQNSTITQPSVLAPNGTATNVSCNGACDGTATVAPTGGTAPYTYSWSPGLQITPSINGLCPGTYTCTVTDNNLCAATYTVTITQPNPLAVNATRVNVTCGGLCNGSATANPTGGTAPYTYLWAPGGQTTQSIVGQCAGNYTVTVTDANGCTATQIVTITEPPTLTVAPTFTNVTCFGLCNGTAAANAAGGAPPYAYVWTPSGGNGATANNLCPNTYTVTVTDANGCTASGTVTITQPSLLTVVMSQVDVTCNAACDGSATATPAGGTAPYTYLWAPGGQTTQTINGLCPGIYTVTVTDANGCTVNGSVTITQPNPLLVNVTFTNVTCFGQCNGTATANPSGGTAPYTYLWTPGGQTTPSIAGQCAGVYTCTVTDARGCTVSQLVTITQPNDLIITINTTALACFGDCNATASATVAGGTPPYTYLWTPGNQITPSISNLCAGNYSVTVTDANGCSSNAIVIITAPTLLTVAGSFTSPSCNGACDATATATPAGGTPPYTYLWNPGGQTTQSINGQCAGNYTVTVTDANGCIATTNIVITSPPALTLVIATQNISCIGNCDGIATANPAGGTPPYTYLWAPGGQTTQSINNLCPGVYTCTVTDAGGCTAVQSITITQPALLTLSVSSVSASCGICNGTATVTPAGGTPPYAYFWNPTGQTSPTATNLCTGNYTVTVTDSRGCTASINVFVPQAITIVITSTSTSVSCFGACDGAATATPSGGTPPYTYLWSPGGQNTASIINLCAGTYTVTVTDANGCFSSASVTFTGPPQLLFATLTGTNINCNGACTGSATAIAGGGTPGYTYLWLPGGQTTTTINNLCIGTYICTVTDSNGCVFTDSVIITQNPPILPNAIITNASCGGNNGAITVNPSGGVGPYTFLWAPGGQTAATIINLIAGVYTVTITDALGCSQSFPIAVSNANGPTVNSNFINPSCNGSCDGSASVNVVAGNAPYTYLWIPGGQTGTNVNGLCAGTYNVQVTDALGCITFASITLVEPAVLAPNQTIVNVDCFGSCTGSITLNVTGGTAPYSYLWGGGQITSSITNQCAGNYTVTITDANGCTLVQNFTINSANLLNLTLTPLDVLCNGACNGSISSVVTGGTLPYTYMWAPGGQGIPNISNLCPGNYTLTVTDVRGCTATQTVTINEPTLLTVTGAQTNVTCNGNCDGTATANPLGGTAPYTYLWSPGGQTTQNINALCAGVYSITITDANGCTANLSVTITQPNALLPNATFTDGTCSGACNGTATVVPTGGTPPYSYLWAPGGQTTASINGLCIGNYTVTVTDANGCSSVQVITISEPLPLAANAFGTNPTCNLGCDGTAIANPTGGTAPYTYQWNPGGQTTASINGLCSGTYTVNITDANGCTTSQIVVLTDPIAITAISAGAPANCGVCDGTLTVTPIGGTAPYSYVWSPNVSNTNTAINLCAGIYTITITDANGCVGTVLIPVNNSSGPTGETVVQTNVSCTGLCDGSATVTPIGGLPPYTYLWIPGGQIVNSRINMCAGTYFLQVTDANGCIHFSPVNITEPTLLNPNAAIINATCSGVCDGSIALAPTGGTPPFSYLWAPGGQTTANISNLCPGAYSVTITDANNCVNTYNYNVNSNIALNGAITTISPTCNGGCNGSATVVASGGAPPYTYLWNDQLGQTTTTATGLCGGNYTVTITDANGCFLVQPVTIVEPAAILANPAITDPTCGLCDGSITVIPSGGTPPYTYNWSNGQTTATVNNICAGVYTVAITDANGCVSNINIPVNNSSGPNSETIVITNASCNGICDGAATVTPIGGVPPYTYLWVPGGQTTNSVNGLCAGNYFVQMMDSNGCIRTTPITITEPAQILTNQMVVNATCGMCDGSITLAPSGGVAPYTYAWLPGGQTTSNLINLCAGVYTVTITDANGCVQTYAIPISNPNAPLATFSTKDVSCGGSCDGTARVIPVGGVPPYTYLWSNGATTDSISSLCPGTYSVTITDASGCSRVVNVTITEPTILALSLTNVIDPSCNGDCNGSSTVVPSGGTLPYVFNWVPTGGNGATTSNLCAGSYTVTVTDANGCSVQQNVTLVDPPLLTLSNTSVSSSCNTIADGSIDITVGGGTLPYSYQWSGASNAVTEDLNNVLLGTYIIVVTDGNGCQITDTITISSSIFVSVDAGNDTTICELSSVTLTGTDTGGVTFQWFAIPTNTPIGNGSKVIVVTPPPGVTGYAFVGYNGLCSDTDTVMVTTNPLPVADAGPDVTIIITQSTVLNGTGAGPGGTYHWSPPAGLSDTTIYNPTATPTETTTYYLTVTNAAGCSSTDSVIVTVLPKIVFPNGITPNGDGANDKWIIDGIEYYKNCVVQVYNRWGENLFTSVGYVEKWDGTFKGKPLPVGTYYYVIDLHDPINTETYTGPLTILR